MEKKFAFSIFILGTIFFVGVQNVKIENVSLIGKNDSIEINPIILKIVKMTDCSIIFKIITKRI